LDNGDTNKEDNNLEVMKTKIVIIFFLYNLILFE